MAAEIGKKILGIVVTILIDVVITKVTGKVIKKKWF